MDIFVWSSSLQKIFRNLSKCVRKSQRILNDLFRIQIYMTFLNALRCSCISNPVLAFNIWDIRKIKRFDSVEIVALGIDSDKEAKMQWNSYSFSNRSTTYGLSLSSKADHCNFVYPIYQNICKHLNWIFFNLNDFDFLVWKILLCLSQCSQPKVSAEMRESDAINSMKNSRNISLQIRWMQE